MSNLKEITFDLIGVVDSGNAKIVKSIVKTNYNESKLSDFSYIIIDSQNILVYNKEILSVNLDFTEKAVFSLIEKWSEMKTEQKGGLFIFEIDSQFYTVSVKNGELKIEYSDMDINLATVLSLYENFKNEQMYFYYEDSSEIKNLFVSLSDMLNIDISFFKQYSIPSDFDIKSISLNFGETALESIKKLFSKSKVDQATKEKKKEDKKTLIDLNSLKENALKYKLYLIGAFLFIALAVAGYIGYLKYEDQKRIEREQAAFLAEQERLKNDNNQGIVKRMNYNTILVEKTLEYISEYDFDSIQNKRLVLHIVSRSKNLLSNEKQEEFNSFKAVKMGQKYLELKQLAIELPDLSKLTIDEIKNIKEGAEDFNDIQKAKFNKYSILETPSKRSAYMINRYSSKEDLIKGLEAFKNMNNFYLNFYLFKLNDNSYEFITTMRK